MNFKSMNLKSALAGLAFTAIGTTLSAAPALAAGNLYETLKSEPQFSTLVKVIDATGTRHNYTSGTRTVFAPTNAAFDKIKGGYDDMLQKIDRENTAALLLYQIVPGTHTPESFKGKSVILTTVQGDPVTIDGSGATLHFGDTFGADQAGDVIKASNGLIIPLDSFPVPVFSAGDDNVAAPVPSKMAPQSPSGNVLAPPSSPMAP
jgi:uncharacterized surface protein with fasciclin (FAS1) repeats